MRGLGGTAPLAFLALVAAWAIAYALVKALKLTSERISLGPFYLLVRFRAPELHVPKSKLTDAVLSLGTALAASLLVYALAFSINNLALFLTHPERSTQLMLILPGLTLPVNTFLAMIPSLTVVLVVHELAHFIAMRFYDVKVTSTGLFVLFAVFGAFVEPDEEQFKSESPKVRSNVAAAGSIANAALALLAPLTLFYLPPFPPLAVFLLFTAWLSVSVAVINMLPITALDGNELLSSLLTEFGIESKRLVDTLSLLSIIILVLNIALSWVSVF